MAAGFKSHLTYYPAQLWQNTKKPFIFSAWSKENGPQYMQVCVCVCTEYKTVLESTVIMKIHEADYRVKVWLQALEDGSVVVTKVRTLPKVHIRDGWPLLKSSNLVLPLANQCCHDPVAPEWLVTWYLCLRFPVTYFSQATAIEINGNA